MSVNGQGYIILSMVNYMVSYNPQLILIIDTSYKFKCKIQELCDVFTLILYTETITKITWSFERAAD